jgi:ADP-ribosylglycohydrolase
VDSGLSQKPSSRHRFLGCLLGGAIGDALGAPVEFMSRADILRTFGPEGIVSYASAYGGIGRITDDTQMTLFTAEGLIRAWVRQSERGITTYEGVTANGYLRWLRTQRYKPGEGWVAEEALAISLYCALVAKDFRHGVILAVNHDGDSDSTGSITGNLLGTILGVDALPREWLEPLELRDVITEIANDLYDCRDWDIGAYGGDPELRDRIWSKYPGV